MKKMYRILAVLVAVAVAAGVLGVWFFLLHPQKLLENFEDGFGEWVADADVPQDPNNPGHPVEWHIHRVTGISHSGQYSLELFIDGRQDDGTIWIERRTALKKRSQVKVSFWFYNEQESFNTRAVVCVYIGTDNPKVEGDFYVLGAADEVAEWRNYTYTATVDASASGELWVAVGISVRWETYLTYYIDDVEIEVSEL
ncbi:MAG: hypothetical protein ACUVTE_05425 [Candidatus Bathycorpusculaceae bacterium]